MRSPARILLALLLLISSDISTALADPPAEDAQWGNLTGRLIYDGEPPKRKRLEVKEGFPEVWDESLVIDPKTHGIANIFVYLLKPKDAEKAVKVHPDYAKHIKKPVRLVIDKKGFTPHVLLVRANQALIISNRLSDVLAMKVDTFRNGFKDHVIPPHQRKEMLYERSERLPVAAGCLIHEWFSACYLIKDDPYMGLTDKDGNFIIENLPVGEHEFQFWQEISGYVVMPPVHLRGQELEGNREKGRLIINIEPGENDLGEIKIDPVEFE